MQAHDVPPEFYRAAFEHAMHAVVAVDGERRIGAANEAAARLFHTTVEELIGRAADAFTRTETPDEGERLWEILLSGGTFRHDVPIVTRDGEHRQVRVAGKGNVVPGLHLTILGDVTRSKEHELSSRRYELLREQAHDILLFVAIDGRILEANRAAELAYGYDRAELVTMSIRELRHDPSDFEAQFRHAVQHGIFFETMHRRKDGSPFPVEVAARLTTVGGENVLLSVIRDVTERKMLHARLLEADRLSTFGMIAAGLAHEINNPLAYVLTNHEMLARELPRLAAKAHAAADGESDPADVAEMAEDLGRCEMMLKVAMEGLQRVRSSVRDLKTFSRADPVEEVLVDLHGVLDSALNVAQNEVHHRARIERCYGEVTPVRGSTSRLGQVFLNLVVNGAQAIPPGRRGQGTVRVSTSTATDGWACIEIVDDGVGMTADARQHLFEPFANKKAGEGTGLGLYITKSIVEAHGGTIEVESRVGVGSRFKVKLQKVAKPAAAAPGWGSTSRRASSRPTAARSRQAARPTAARC
jgi:PAS domain S-box-containing protein